MLSEKIYRTEDETTVCKPCTINFLNTGVSFSPVPTGTPCTCEMCGLRFKSK